MGGSEPGSVRRAENPRPVGTSARCFPPRLDNGEDRAPAATLSWPRNLELDRVERAILQNHAPQVIDIDDHQAAVELVFVPQHQIRNLMQSQSECHIELPQNSVVT